MGTFVPKVVSFDVETEDGTGLGSTEFWRPDFKITCAAVSWRQDGVIKSKWSRNVYADIIRPLSLLNVPIIAHNSAFELGCVETLYPDTPLNIKYDTMRLAALYDAGVADEVDEELLEEGEEKDPDGISLSACAKRILGQADSKEIADQLIIKLFPGISVKEFGKYKVKLPTENLRLYNIGDTELTLQLFEYLTDVFDKEGYDWTIDHELYMNLCKLISQSQARGVKVNREPLAQYVTQIAAEITQIEQDFLAAEAPAIEQVQQKLLQAKLGLYKTERGKMGCKLPPFNVGSNKQLEELFVGVQGMDVKFKTPTGKPSFRADHLNQFAPSGLILKNRKKRMIVERQAERLLEFSEADGRWHVQLAPHGTKTGRGAGRGKLNCQGLARRDKGLMSVIEADTGSTVVSSDGVSMEPTITAALSGDENYRLCTFDMVGKTPYWDNGLVLDDIYLYVASRNSMTCDKIKEAWNMNWDGKTFAEQWISDNEVIKKWLKDIRSFTKVLVLATGYGAGPKKLQSYSYTKGYSVTLEEARKFWLTYWSLFPKVKELFDRMSNITEQHGHFINPFGFRLVPGESHKSGNFLVQSSASGLLNLYIKLLFERASFIQFQTLIHDEILFQCPTHRLEECKQIKESVEQQINDLLQWSVRIRFGWAEGKNWYDAK